MERVAKETGMYVCNTDTYYKWKNKADRVIIIIIKNQEKKSSKKYFQERLGLWHGLGS